MPEEPPGDPYASTLVNIGGALFLASLLGTFVGVLRVDADGEHYIPRGGWLAYIWALGALLCGNHRGAQVLVQAVAIDRRQEGARFGEVPFAFSPSSANLRIASAREGKSS